MRGVGWEREVFVAGQCCRMLGVVECSFLSNPPRLACFRASGDVVANMTEAHKVALICVATVSFNNFDLSHIHLTSPVSEPVAM